MLTKKKLNAMMVAMVMLVVTTLCSVSASAAKVKEIYLDNYSVEAISNGKEFTTAKNDYGEDWYKLNLKSDAAVAFTLDGLGITGSTQVDIYKAVDKTTAGEEVYKLDWGYKGSYTAKLDKGSYFVRFTRPNTIVKFTWKEKEPAVKSLKVYMPLEKGSTVNLSAVVEGANVPITYKSSNTKVATVSSKGVVTGKAAGKVSVTIKAGTKTVKLYFKVS